jgi:hypothetical protein
MNERPSASSGVVGYMLVLVGVAAFVLSCFLLYTRFSDQVSISYYRLATMSRGGTLEYVGGILFLFGGTATVAWVALAGLRHGHHLPRRVGQDPCVPARVRDLHPLPRRAARASP